MDLENDKVNIWRSHHDLWLPTGDTWSYEPLQVVGIGAALAMSLS